ncbi:hypothetical protein H5410_011300 [Solanum commersonii]|uniref:Uncharacterized protein n=1 Tax=Solanum commersonii TaxID=4109 RepID=A0A9J6APJ2_SOLCO|nr:hypothetical protein H5410_011300 [Solanum commersonii]
MSRPLFSFKFAFFFSLSLAASYTVTSTPTFYSFRKLKLRSSSASPSVPKASAADLLALLGPPQQALAVNSQEAHQLRSCFKFLVPFSPSSQTPNRRSLSSKLSDDRRSISEENELIWWPPAPIMELARLAVDSGGDTTSIQRTLDPTVIPVPDIEGSKEDRCELTRTPYGRLFINEEINSFLESLFEMIVTRGPSVGLNVSLSRFDFFHGHVFLARDSGRLGIFSYHCECTEATWRHALDFGYRAKNHGGNHSWILTTFSQREPDWFHAKEYPVYDKEVFPCNMGYCQIGTNVSYDDSMNLRNILWLAPLASNSSNEWLAPGDPVATTKVGVRSAHIPPPQTPLVGLHWALATNNRHWTGVLVVLDARPTGVIYKDLIPEYVQIARTLYEDDFGDVAFDVNYLNTGGEPPKFQIFIC